MLPKKAIEEYQAIYKKVYGEEITYKEALKQGTNLLDFFRIIYKPIPKDGYINPASSKNIRKEGQKTK